MKTVHTIVKKFLKELDSHKYLLFRDKANEMIICGKKPKIIKSDDVGRKIKEIKEINFEDGLCSVVFENGDESAWFRLEDLKVIK